MNTNEGNGEPNGDVNGFTEKREDFNTRDLPGNEGSVPAGSDEEAEKDDYSNAELVDDEQGYEAEEVFANDESTQDQMSDAGDPAEAAETVNALSDTDTGEQQTGETDDETQSFPEHYRKIDEDTTDLANQKNPEE